MLSNPYVAGASGGSAEDQRRAESNGRQPTKQSCECLDTPVDTWLCPSTHCHSASRSEPAFHGCGSIVSAEGHSARARCANLSLSAACSPWLVSGTIDWSNSLNATPQALGSLTPTPQTPKPKPQTQNPKPQTHTPNQLSPRTWNHQS